MKIQSSHSHSDRGLDPYFTPPEATYSLLAIETIPEYIWEPAAGDGAISKILQRYCKTNPPFRLAMEFVQKALSEVPYVALLLRTNFLESTSRLPFFRQSPSSRVWISSRRLPMMHRFGWTGPTAPSNTCHAWFIWDSRRDESGAIFRTGPILHWFDWADYTPNNLQSPTSAEELGL